MAKRWDSSQRVIGLIDGRWTLAVLADDLGIRYVLQSERMSHEVPGMRDVYGHITPRMRDELKTGLQDLWEESLRQRAGIAPTSAVATLDDLLAPRRERGTEIDISQSCRSEPDQDVGEITAAQLPPRGR
jgi:hypothetical protein